MLLPDRVTSFAEVHFSTAPPIRGLFRRFRPPLFAAIFAEKPHFLGIMPRRQSFLLPLCPFCCTEMNNPPFYGLLPREVVATPPLPTASANTLLLLRGFSRPRGLPLPPAATPYPRLPALLPVLCCELCGGAFLLPPCRPTAVQMPSQRHFAPYPALPQAFLMLLAPLFVTSFASRDLFLDVIFCFT